MIKGAQMKSFGKKSINSRLTVDEYIRPNTALKQRLRRPEGTINFLEDTRDRKEYSNPANREKSLSNDTKHVKIID